MDRTMHDLTFPTAPITAAVLVIVLGVPAYGGSVNVHKVIQPIVMETQATSTWTTEDEPCYPFACPLGIAPPLMLPSADGLASVGFEPAFAYRARILFGTSDLPHHFTHATLALNATSVVNTANLASPLMTTFETSLADPSPQPWFLRGVLHQDVDTRQITVSSHRVDGFDNSQLQGMVTGSTQNGPGFSLRIDVTANVNKWLQDWPKRNQTPLHGFVLMGQNESLVLGITSVVTYQAQLEFDIDESDQ
jgi:hypothetical protein